MFISRALTPIRLQPVVMCEESSEEMILRESPLLDIVSNPLHLFLFCSLYSIWFGGFTRQQLFNYFYKKDKEK